MSLRPTLSNLPSTTWPVPATLVMYSRLSDIAAPGGGSAALAPAGTSSSIAAAAANAQLLLIAPPLLVKLLGARTYRIGRGGSMSSACATRGRPSTSQVTSTWSFLR